ncbi:MAG: DUF3365 domain-containing protein, partial [Burkholderiaceae bacterium]|nr:DUF3365 domain-containing protein [Burkholderiaceae bacterium]
IRVEPYCLRCHGKPEEAPPSIRARYETAYGYQVGDLRGVVSIKVPYDKFEKRFAALWRERLAKSLAGYLAFFIAVGILLDRLVTRRLA